MVHIEGNLANLPHLAKRIKSALSSVETDLWITSRRPTEDDADEFGKVFSRRPDGDTYIVRWDSDEIQAKGYPWTEVHRPDFYRTDAWRLHAPPTADDADRSGWVWVRHSDGTVQSERWDSEAARFLPWAKIQRPTDDTVVDVEQDMRDTVWRIRFS